MFRSERVNKISKIVRKFLLVWKRRQRETASAERVDVNKRFGARRVVGVEKGNVHRQIGD